MTILPKKKAPQSRTEAESAADATSLQHLSVVGSNNHLAHIGPVTGHPQVNTNIRFLVELVAGEDCSLFPRISRRGIIYSFVPLLSECRTGLLGQ